MKETEIIKKYYNDYKNIYQMLKSCQHIITTLSDKNAKLRKLIWILLFKI